MKLALTLSTLVSCGDPQRRKLRRKPLARSGLSPSFCPKSSSRELRSMESSRSSSREPLHTLLRPSTRSLGIRSQLRLRSRFLRPESTRVRPLAETGGGGGGGGRRRRRRDRGWWDGDGGHGFHFLFLGVKVCSWNVEDLVSRQMISHRWKVHKKDAVHSPHGCDVYLQRETG